MPNNLSEALEYLANEIEKDVKGGLAELDIEVIHATLLAYVRTIKMAVLMTKDKPVFRDECFDVPDMRIK